MDVREKGKYGEETATNYLERNGYEIIERNFHSRYGEIDIIAKNKKFLIFVEVKLRKRGSLVSPVEAVNKSKQKKIMKTAVIYISKVSSQLQPRFDIIEIEDKSINHIKNAFYQEGYQGYAAF